MNYLQCIKVKEHQASIAHVFAQIKELLARFGIDDASECALQDVTDNHPDSVKLPGWCVYQGKLLLPLNKLVAFQECVGFRYCMHKQQRLAVATAYLRTRDYSCEQRRRFIDRVKELTGYDTAPLIAGDSRDRKQLVMTIAEAYKLTKVEMEQKEVYLDKDVAIPTYLAVSATLNGHNDVERTGAQSFKVSPVRWLAQVGASAFFSEPAGADAPGVRAARIFLCMLMFLAGGS